MILTLPGRPFSSFGRFIAHDTSWIGAVVGSDAQSTASGRAARASKESEILNLQWQMMQYNQQRADLKPWLKAGQGAINQLAEGTKEGGQFATTPQFKFDQSQVDVTKDPGYAFRMSQGQNALTAGSAAAGNYGSGNLGVALQSYGQDLGSQEYGAAYNRQYTSALDQYNAAVLSQNTVYNRLAGIAGTGQTSANTLASAGQASAANIGNTLMSGAQYRGQLGMNAATNSANMLSNAFSNVSNSASQFGNQLGNYYSQQNALNNSLYGNNINYGGSGGYGFGSNSWDGSGMGSYDIGMGTGSGADSLFGGGF